MALESAAHQHGAVILPLTVASPNSLLRDADPAIFYALEYFQWVLDDKIGRRFESAAASAGIILNKAVAHAIPIEPSLHLATNAVEFPLLSVHRGKGRTDDKTTTYRQTKTRIIVHYVLPPMNAGQAEQLRPILNAVKIALDRAVAVGFDPAFTPSGGEVGDTPWALERGGIQKIELEEASHSAFEIADGLPMACLVYEGMLSERDSVPEGAYDDLTAVTATVEVIDPVDGSSAGTVGEVTTTNAPTLDSISPTSAPDTGGTTLTLTGTLFRAPASVSVGGTACTGVVVVDETTITCVSPAVAAYVTTAEVIVVCAGQEVLTPGALTIT